jgi:hypothetical protein
MGKGLSILSNQHNGLAYPSFDFYKFTLNLSEHILTDTEEAALMKVLNFSVTYPHSNLDIACGVESVVAKLPQRLGMKIMWKIRPTLGKT